MAEPTSSTPSLPAKSDADVEEILDRMLTRLALCEDDKLQSLLSKLLPLTLSSLASQATSVRNKVLEILSHVNKRVKHHPDIGFPLSELWQLFIEAKSTPMVKNFCIMYVEMAFDRVSSKEKENLAPTLLVNISKISSQHQDIIFRIVSKVIGECHASSIADEVSAKYKLINGSRDNELFIEFCLHTVLYQLVPQSGGCPPGLSIAQSNRVSGKHQPTKDTLMKTKLGILNVIEAMELPPELIYPLLVAASADCQEPVLKRGEELLKKKASTANLDDLNLINRLFLLLNGTTGAENVSSESRVSPGSAALKVKLMSVFCRSITAANNFPATLQCIFGCIFGIGTTSRIKQLGMEFTVWVFKHAKIEQLKLMGPVVLNSIIKLLDTNLNLEADALARDTKMFCFQAIGLLAQRLPQLFRDKIDMAVRLFDALKWEVPHLRVIVQEATNSLAAAYKGAPATVLDDLERLLLNNSQAEESESRFCAVRWATLLFDLQHSPSRFICMLGAADSKLDIREMAIGGLFPAEDRQDLGQRVDLSYPKLGDMLGYILKQEPRLLESTEMREQKLLFSTQMYVVMIKFLLKCFGSELEQNKSLGKSSEFPSSVEQMCFLLEHSMAYEGSPELHAIASKALITIGSHFPEMIASRYAFRVSWLKQLLSHMDSSTRESAARLLGLASSALPTPTSSTLISELVSSISGSQKLRFEVQHGTICAIGFITADCVSKSPGIGETLFRSINSCLIEVVKSGPATLASVAMQALGHIGLCAPLPPVVNGSCSAEVLKVLHEKLSKLLSGDDTKAIQKILISLGHICMKETSSSHLNNALDLIFSLCRSKVEDILLAAGEALSFLWGGVSVTADVILKTNYTTLSMTSNFLMGGLSESLSTFRSDGDSGANKDHILMVRHEITRKLFDVLLYSSRKEERCAGTVWLLSLTMYCGHHPSIQQMLPQIQEAFSHLLGEQNELTQELASQGMSIVYDIGDASMKKSLVEALVGTLTGSGKRKRAVKLVEESEVFQEGAIGESVNGGKLSTYKELCGLANEMGQPDLIYKFMDLANYQASLNSKRGAAFGFSKIAKQAGDALQPHLRSLIPRLVRYQYDPDKNVQDAMSHIWKSLVTDSKRTINEQLDPIIDDLAVQCGSRLWRSREASCLALADIIQGRKFDQVGKHLKRLWIAAFRAMDDIKETVRNAGDKLCRSMTSLTLRLCDVTLTEKSDASQAMAIVLPLFLSEGIPSKVDNIRKSSIGVVMKIAKGAGIALRPHLPELVCCMLECLSSLEDQGLNYVELHAASVGIQTEKLENLRISLAKGSLMWETLDLCINVIDGESLDILIPRLAHLVRSAVGLNTRVGVASFISLLLQKVGMDIKPFTSMLLRLLFPVVKEERSTAAKRAFASACAMVLKYASSAQAQKLIEESVALHSGDRNAQISCAILLKNYFSISSDVLNGHHASVIPIIFISRFEDDKYVSGLFEELWEENTSGDRVTLQLYLAEIVTLICEGMSSSSWASKHKSAVAIFKLSEVLGELLSSYHQVLLGCLTKEVPGRFWEGKEALLNSIGALSKSCHQVISAADPATSKFLLSLVSSACTKKVKKYREAAFSCLREVIEAFGNPEFFNMIFPQLFEMCSLDTSKPGVVPLGNELSKAELDDTKDPSIPLDKILECISSCIHVGCAHDIIEQRKNVMHVLLLGFSPGFQWSVKMLAFSSIKELCKRLEKMLIDCEAGGPLDASVTCLVQELFLSVSPKVVECLTTLKIGQVHVGASDCLVEVAKLYKRLGVEVGSKAELMVELVRVYELEKNAEAKSLLKRSIEILA